MSHDANTFCAASGRIGRTYFSPPSPMKTYWLVPLLTVVVCAGCSTRYSVTLRNGSPVTALSKPHLDQSGTRYVFKDASGQPMEVSRMAVCEISTESMKSRDAPTFLPT